MNSTIRSCVTAVLLVVLGSQQGSGQQIHLPGETPRARMRPIGSPSAVDLYRNQPTPGAGSVHETSYHRPGNRIAHQTIDQTMRSAGQLGGHASPIPASSSQDNPLRQTAMQFALPEGQGSGSRGPVGSSPSVRPTPSATPPSAATFSPPPLRSSPSQSVPPSPQAPGPLSQQAFPSQPASPPATLPFSGSGQALPSQALPVQPRSDYAPITPPALSGSFANISNCPNISGPSGYTAALVGHCGSGFANAPVSFQAPPAELASPALLPGAPITTGPPVATGPFASVPGGPLAAVGSPADAMPIGSLVTFGQEQNLVQVGQGIIGQPKAYVPGQPIRNWLRYFTP